VNFELFQPKTIEDALAQAGRAGNRGRFIAGGTDLMVQMRRGRQCPEVLVDLSQLEGLDRIAADGDGFRPFAPVA
jgi:CO/xanthine dehydrogenase FAD-binding subunit